MQEGQTWYTRSGRLVLITRVMTHDSLKEGGKLMMLGWDDIDSLPCLWEIEDRLERKASEAPLDLGTFFSIMTSKAMVHAKRNP